MDIRPVEQHCLSWLFYTIICFYYYCGYRSYCGYCMSVVVYHPLTIPCIAHSNIDIRTLKNKKVWIWWSNWWHNVYIRSQQNIFRRKTLNIWYAFLTRTLYPLFNKNQAAWNFLSPELEVMWRTVAIIIRVVFSFPIFVNSWRFSVSHSLQSITPRIY
jgi:hypothetical protein